MAWHDAETIRGTLACLNPFVSKHYVFIYEKPFYGQNEGPDETEAICREFDKVEVIKGFWQEHVARNIGQTLCGDCDWTIGFDADEMMTADDLLKLTDVLHKTDKDAVGFISKVYWKTPDYIFHPDPDHIKVCVTRRKCRFWEKQCVDVPFDVLDYKRGERITHHHLSWSAPKDILRKVLHYNHANEFNGQEWYDKHYRDWKPGDKVVQPFGTEWEAVWNPLPEELRRLL